MKKQNSRKSLLVAAGLCVGQVLTGEFGKKRKNIWLFSTKTIILRAKY